MYQWIGFGAPLDLHVMLAEQSGLTSLERSSTPLISMCSISLPQDTPFNPLLLRSTTMSPSSHSDTPVHSSSVQQYFRLSKPGVPIQLICGHRFYASLQGSINRAARPCFPEQTWHTILLLMYLPAFFSKRGSGLMYFESVLLHLGHLITIRGLSPE